MPRSLALALLALATAMPAAAAVERGEHRIRLTLEGVGGMANDAGCPAQPGKEVIEGTVKGNEALLTSTSKSVEYIGTLDRKSNTVICDLEGQEDQTDYCVTQLTGSSKVELTIRIYADRPGAYLEWHPIGRVTVSAKGDCDAELTDLARSAYLTEGGFAEIATVPKGALVDDKSHVEIGGGSSAKLEVLPKVGIQAKPGGPYSIERAATIVLDGSGSTPSQGHAIQSYEWKLTPTGKPDGCAGIGSPTTMTGATVTFVALCSVAAELTVRDDGGEQDTDEVEVTVKARPWQTKFTTDDAIRQESFTFVANGFVFGYNRCRRAGHFDENSNHWYEPRAVGSHDFEQSSFWLGQVTDGGPFAGIHFVTRGVFEIQRALWVNKKLYPGGEVYDLNPGPKRQLKPCSAPGATCSFGESVIDRLRRSVEAHEKLHSTLAQRALGAHTDPAKDAESSMAADRAVLKDRTNLYFTTAVSNLTTASSELKVKAEMRRISEFVPGGCIDFPAWDSAVRGGCYFLFASFADKGE